MPEEKLNKSKQEGKPEQDGLFPFKVKKFLSGVASAGHAALEEAQSLRQENTNRRNMQRMASVTESSAGVTATKNESSKLPKAPTTPTSTGRFAVAVSPELVADMSHGGNDNDWEMLSAGERASNCSEVFVSGPRAGSVRSIATLDHDSSHQTRLSVPFKIQRTNSSSTIDSQDNVLGPSGKGVLGVDYVEHVVLPTDTLQGICIAYKVSASQLRRANHFSGTLHSAPKKLLIPLSKQALRTGYIRVQDTDTKEYKLHYFQAEFPDISAPEAKGYLELADWDLKVALQSAKEDREWESGDDMDPNCCADHCLESLKSGQIGIKVGFSGNFPTFNLTGSGHSSSFKLMMKKNNRSQDELGENNRKDEKVVVYSRPPSIATKSVRSEDLYDAAHQHNSYGFELKPINKRNLSTD